MIRGEIVRLEDGKMVHPADLRTAAQERLGYTYSLVYVETDWEDVREDARGGRASVHAHGRRS